MYMCVCVCVCVCVCMCVYYSDFKDFWKKSGKYTLTYIFGNN